MQPNQGADLCPNRTRHGVELMKPVSILFNHRSLQQPTVFPGLLEVS